MLGKTFSVLLDLYAFVTPISIAATNIVFFPLGVIWLFGARWTWTTWPPLWGWPEKLFLVYLGTSLVSALAGIDPVHSLKEIRNKDLYILILVVLVALVREREKNARLLRIFMMAGILTAVWGLIQYSIGVSQTDKSNGIFLYLPPALAHWPRPVLNLLSLLHGRVMGTRGHPLAYAECLLFNWALAICFLLASRDHAWIRWLLATTLIGAALMVSQSRGPWIAAGIILLAAMVTSSFRRSWALLAVGVLFLSLFAVVPAMRARAASILDRSHISNMTRVHMWRAGVVIWKTHPLLGVGPGNVKQLSDPFQTVEERAWGSWGHLHSNYINALAERGAFGLVTFLLFIGAICRELWHALRKSSTDPWAFSVYQAALLGILGFMIGGFTETSYNTAVVKMMLYFVIGLALALARHEEASRV